jgi:hypothetical protein
MRRLIRWISLAALAVLVLPILHEFALQHHLYENPTASASTLLEYVRRIGDLPHFMCVLAFVGGLTRSYGPRYPARKRSLGAGPL